ncbi:carbon-nitrogen hydrolase family protein [Actibacterium ureilyticum]|uniref:carbon-nitrogen hydrolase family protein n=1 Tax=Actibacterium ureilyticum TaxID=1590614 RepID=UPI001594EEAD|nr:carbon-nitrogen hydrolase family protein [Actibacterium ureilyticum]
MKLGIIQLSAARDTPERIVALMEAAISESTAQDVDLVVFPELTLPGYNVPERHQRDAQSTDGLWMTRIAGMAREYRCAIALGWAERADDTVYNSATVVARTGDVVAHYRKRQLFGAMEHESFAHGTAPAPIFEIAGRKCGLLICYEIEFPEYARDLARRGAEVVIVPTANPKGYEHVQDVLIPARACENRQFVAYANYCGEQAGLEFSGLSLVAGPDGKPLARAGCEPTALYVQLPELADYPAQSLSTQLADLRQLAARSDVPHL